MSDAAFPQTVTASRPAAVKYGVTILPDCCSTVSEILHLIALHAVSTRVKLVPSSEALWPPAGRWAVSPQTVGPSDIGRRIALAILRCGEKSSGEDLVLVVEVMHRWRNKSASWVLYWWVPVIPFG